MIARNKFKGHHHIFTSKKIAYTTLEREGKKQGKLQIKNLSTWLASAFGCHETHHRTILVLRRVLGGLDLLHGNDLSLFFLFKEDPSL